MLRIGWIFTVVRKPEGKGWFVTIHKFRFVNLSIFQRRYDELSTDYRTFKAVLESTRSLLYENARRFACREREREEMAEEGETEIRSGRGVARLEKRREVESRGNNFPRERFPRKIWSRGAQEERSNKIFNFKRRLSPLVLSKYSLRTFPQIFDSTSNG